MLCWEYFSMLVAMLLAMTAAVISSPMEARQGVAGYVAEALRPQTTDLGSDPNEAIWLLPPRLASVNPAAG